MVEESLEPQTSTALGNDRNLYCLECGYNLRGLSGDPLRCPECGSLNPLSDLTLPAGIIDKQLRIMETAPTFCLAATTGVALLVVLLIAWSAAGDPEELGPRLASSICVLSGIGAFAWMVWWQSATSFKIACQDSPAWRPTLVRYHRLGVPIVLLTGAAILTTGLMLRNHMSHPDLLILVLDGLLIAGALLAGRWARREIKLMMDPLQRQTAIRIARQTLLQRMRRGR